MRLSDAVQRQHRLLNLAAALWYPEPGDPTHSDALLSTFALVRAAMARGRMDWKSTGIHSRYAQIENVPRHMANVSRGLPAVGGYGAMWARKRWLSSARFRPSWPARRPGSMRLRFDAEQSPDAANRVRLSRERDEFGVPRLSLAYRVSAGDRESIGRSLALIGVGARAPRRRPRWSCPPQRRRWRTCPSVTGRTNWALRGWPPIRITAWWTRAAASTVRLTSWSRVAPSSPPQRQSGPRSPSWLSPSAQPTSLPPS